MWGFGNFVRTGTVFLLLILAVLPSCQAAKEAAILIPSLPQTSPKCTFNATGVVDVGCPCSVENGTFSVFPISILVRGTNNFTISNISRAFVASRELVNEHCRRWGGGCGLCAAGSECVGNIVTSSSNNGSNFNNSSRNNGTYYGTCLPCSLGKFCPEGSVNPIDVSDANLCSAGYFCDTAETVDICPVGHFCPQGTIQPILCNQTDLDGRPIMPLQAVYCKQGSPHPIIPCPCGFYCPTPAELIPCPKHHYCPVLSLKPVTCWPFANCNGGTCSPDASILGWLLAFISFLAFIGISFFFHLWWRTVQDRQASVAVFNKKVDTLRTSLLKIAGGTDLFGGNSSNSNVVAGFEPKSVRLSVSFKALGLQLADGSMVLSGVTGVFPHSNLIAIMGPSGSGKTTMLNVLCGKARYGTMKGELRVNDHVVRLSDLKSVTGFVPQDDVVHTELTVLENLIFSARLRQAQGVSIERQDQIITNTINILQLTHVQNTVVGSPEHRGISGGQRKRVNVGLELVADPTLLFLDEPTSGLDSTSSEEILGCLKNMATLGMTIVAVIHQPRASIFDMFDCVMLLGKGGRTTYLGPSNAAKDYFAMIGFECPTNVTPPDHFLDVLSNRRVNSQDSSIRAEDLPTIWSKQLQNGYIPEAPPVVRLRDEQARRKMLQTTYLIQTVRELFAATNPESTIDEGVSYYEVNKVMTSMGVTVTESERVHMMKEFDPQNTGKITPRNFVKALIRMTNPKRKRRSDTPSVRPVSTMNLPTLLNSLNHADLFTELRSHDLPTTGMFADLAAGNTHQQQKQESQQHSQMTSTRMTPITPITLTSETDNTPATSKITRFATATLKVPNFGMGSKRDSLLEALELVNTSSSDVLDQSSPDLAACGVRYTRRRKSFLTQLFAILHRNLIKGWRTRTKRILDLVLTVVSAALIGGIEGSNWSIGHIVPNFMQAHLALSVLTCSAALFPFRDHVIYWREAAAGINRPAFFLATTLLDLMDVLARPCIFSMVFLSITSPIITLGDFTVVCCLLAWAWSGVAYLLIHLLPKNAAVAAVLLPLIFGGVLSGVEPTIASADDKPLLQFLFAISPNRWSIEAATISQLNGLPQHLAKFIHQLLNKVGYENMAYSRNCGILFVMGFAFRLLAFVAMILCNRHKQV